MIMIMLSLGQMLHVSQIEGAVMLASKYETYEKALSHIYDPRLYKVHLDKGFI